MALRTTIRLARNHVKHERTKQRDYRRTRRLVLAYGEVREGLFDEWMRPKKGQLEHDNVLARGMRENMSPEELETLVQQCLAVLPSEHERVVRMLYFEHHSSQEAADELGLPKTTVDWYKRAALEKMRSAVGAAP